MSIVIIPLLKKALEEDFKKDLDIAIEYWLDGKYLDTQFLLESILVKENKKKKPDRTKYYADIIIVLDKVQEHVNYIYGEDN